MSGELLEFQNGAMGQVFNLEEDSIGSVVFGDYLGIKEGDTVKRTAQFGIPVIAGIWPLTSFRNAEFMVNELRVPVPQEYMDRMRNAENADAARATGVAIAQDMVQRARPLTAGVQLSAPFGRYEMAIEVAQAIA